MIFSKKYTARDIAKLSLLTALLSISSYIIIPLPFSLASITAQTIIINLIAFILKPKESFLVILIYLLLGLIGIPVFAGGASGPAALFGPTGGYFLGFLISATLISYLKGNSFKMIKCLVLSILVGMPIIYFCGAVYMHILTGMTLGATISSAILPFIPLDILKCFLAAVLAKALNKAIVYSYS